MLKVLQKVLNHLYLFFHNHMQPQLSLRLLAENTIARHISKAEDISQQYKKQLADLETANARAIQHVKGVQCYVRQALNADFCPFMILASLAATAVLVPRR